MPGLIILDGRDVDSKDLHDLIKVHFSIMHIAKIILDLFIIITEPGCQEEAILSTKNTQPSAEVARGEKGH